MASLPESFRFGGGWPYDSKIGEIGPGIRTLALSL
jgi:hypothetical protein